MLAVPLKTSASTSFPSANDYVPVPSSLRNPKFIGPRIAAYHADISLPSYPLHPASPSNQPPIITSPRITAPEHPKEESQYISKHLQTVDVSYSSVLKDLLSGERFLVVAELFCPIASFASVVTLPMYLYLPDLALPKASVIEGCLIACF